MPVKMLRKKTKIAKVVSAVNQDEVIETLETSKISKPFKKRIMRFIRNLFIGIGVLLIIAIVAGVAYTWYMGRNSTVADIEAPKPVDTTLPLVAPSTPASNAKIGSAVQVLTSPVAPGSNATITIKTNAKANCKITVVYNEVASKDSGLYAKTADEYGVASWTWTVAKDVPIGKWPVTVTCVNDTKSAVVVGDLVVADKATAEN
jgi:flagellar basal body-associated protein FliL